MRKKYDLVTVGDCVVDAFIQLREASVHCDKNHEQCELCMAFGDKIPYDSLVVMPAVGNSSNVAVGTRRLGLRTAILAAIGDDYYGKQILDVYRREKVSPEFVKINKGIPTNYHFVLTFKAERTILIKHENYDYYSPNLLGSTDWIYFSSMGEHTLPFHRKLADYLARHPRVRMGFNPGTYQLRFGKDKLRDIYRRSHVLFVNREEAGHILGIGDLDIKKLLYGLHGLGPKIVVITDGPSGAYASDGRERLFIPKHSDPKPPVSRTGAGDAFSSGFMAALIYGLPLEDALRWGPVESMRVVQFFGAQTGLLTKNEILTLLNKAPRSFKPKKI